VFKESPGDKFLQEDESFPELGCSAAEIHFFRLLTGRDARSDQKIPASYLPLYLYNCFSPQNEAKTMPLGLFLQPALAFRQFVVLLLVVFVYHLLLTENAKCVNY